MFVNFTGFQQKAEVLADSTVRGRRLQMFYKDGALNNFGKFTKNHLCWSDFLLKLQPSTGKKDMLMQPSVMTQQWRRRNDGLA